MTHSSIYGVGSVLNRIGVFILLPVYTNYLSVAEYGRLEMFYTLASIVAGLLSVGLAHATLRFYFEYDDSAARRQVVSTNLIAATLLAIVGAAAVVPFGRGLSLALFGDTAQQAGIPIVLTSMVLELSTQIGLAYLRARERSLLFISAVVLRLVVQVGVNTWLVMAQGAGVLGVLTGNCIAIAVSWALVTGVTVRDCGLTFRWDKARPVLRYSYPFLLSSVLAVVAANVDRVFIRSLLSFEALGLFALATKFSRLLEELIGVPFSRAYGAFRFSIMHQDNAAEIQSRVTRALFGVSLLAGLGVLLFAGDVLALLSDESFAGAAQLLPLLICAAVARVMIYPLQTGILVCKCTREIFYLSLVDAALYVGVSFVLISTIGIRGACLALALAALVMLLLTDRVAQRHFPVEYRYERWARMLLITIAGAFVGAPLRGVPVLLGIPVKALVLAFTAWAMLRSSAFDEEEREMALSWLRHLRRRLQGRFAGVGVAHAGRAA